MRKHKKECLILLLLAVFLTALGGCSSTGEPTIVADQPTEIARVTLTITKPPTATRLYVTATMPPSLTPLSVPPTPLVPTSLPTLTPNPAATEVSPTPSPVPKATATLTATVETATELSPTPSPALEETATLTATVETATELSPTPSPAPEETATLIVTVEIVTDLSPTPSPAPEETATLTATVETVAELSPTPLPSTTATMIPTKWPTKTQWPTKTVQPTKTPQPTWTRVRPTQTAIATDIPSTTLPTDIPPIATDSPDAISSPIPTVIPVPTSTMTLNVPSQSVSIDYFRVLPNLDTPLSPVIEWRVIGEQVGLFLKITRSGGEWGEADWKGESRLLEGRISPELPDTVGGWPIRYLLEVIDSSGNLLDSAEVTQAGDCPYPWLFSFPYPGTSCPAEGITSAAFQQNFEKGFMIWIASQKIILYSTWDGMTHGEIVDSYQQGVDPIKDETLEVPIGRYQPEYGIGKAWRENPIIRMALGWGTDWGADFTLVRQTTPSSRYGYQEFISMKGGGLIGIQHPDPVWQIDSPR